MELKHYLTALTTELCNLLHPTKLCLNLIQVFTTQTCFVVFNLSMCVKCVSKNVRPIMRPNWHTWHRMICFTTGPSQHNMAAKKPCCWQQIEVSGEFTPLSFHYTYMLMFNFVYGTNCLCSGTIVFKLVQNYFIKLVSSYLLKNL